MQTLGVNFPLPLYSELRACIALAKWFVQGSSNVHVSAISKRPLSHPVAFPVDMQET